MKINSMTILLAVGTGLTAALDKITSATAWGDLLQPLPLFSMLGPALLTAAAHIMRTPKEKEVADARETLGLPERRNR